MSIADVDGDGRDEIIYGAAVIDDDGKGLYFTGWGHGDALHVGDLDPDNPGLKVFNIQERFSKEGMNLRDARTGGPLWLVSSLSDDGSAGTVVRGQAGAYVLMWILGIKVMRPGHLVLAWLG